MTVGITDNKSMSKLLSSVYESNGNNVLYMCTYRSLAAVAVHRYVHTVLVRISLCAGVDDNDRLIGLSFPGFVCHSVTSRFFESP